MNEDPSSWQWIKLCSRLNNTRKDLTFIFNTSCWIYFLTSNKNSFNSITNWSFLYFGFVPTSRPGCKQPIPHHLMWRWVASFILHQLDQKQEEERTNRVQRLNSESLAFIASFLCIPLIGRRCIGLNKWRIASSCTSNSYGPSCGGRKIGPSAKIDVGNLH